MKDLVSHPSILAQIFRGLAYAAVGLVALSIIFTFTSPHQRLPKDFIPPREGFNLKYIWMALFEYAGEHDSQYPKDLQSIANSGFLTGGDPQRGDILSSPYLKYYPPKKPIQNPYNKDDKDTILLTYETDKWFFSVGVGSELKYGRKKTEK